jgi:hypothetical protein
VEQQLALPHVRDTADAREVLVKSIGKFIAAPSQSLRREPAPRAVTSTLALSLAAAGVFAACGGRVDEGFSAESFDEHTEPLTNAIVGTPDGKVIVTGPDGTVISTGTIATDSAAVDDGGAVPIAGEVVDESGFGFWHFDDCSPSSHFLADSSGLGASAQHELGAECVQGISDQAVEFRSPRDVVQVADQPQFTVDSRVAVAAWVNPRTVEGDHPIVIKRLNRQTSFSLGIHEGNIEMSVVLSDGTTVVSRAPIEAGVFTHVAGMFDGTFLFLFINGQQFGQIFAKGTLRNVFAPVRIGATSQSQFFDGTIDEVFVSTEVVSKESIIALSCIHHPTTFTVNPLSSGPVPPDTTVEYDVAVQNNDVGACGATEYDLFQSNFEQGINVSFDTQFQLIEPGSTGNFSVFVTGTEDADPGEHDVALNLFSFGSEFESFEFDVTYELTPPTGCFVSSRRELMITSLSVVDDPVRTAGNGTGVTGVGFPPPLIGVPVSPPPSRPPRPIIDVATTSRVDSISSAFAAADAGVALPPDAPVAGGVWSLGHLMRELAPTPEDASKMMEDVLRTFTTPQVVNGFVVQPRPGMQTTILDNWPRTATGALDLDHAPVTLEAIVNRLDVRDLSVGSAGEGRFVFGVNGPGGFPLQFTMIFEYNLPGTTEADLLDWANRWHSLQSHPFPSEEYNGALEEITRRFSSRGASPGAVNGSALFSFRTNEIDLGNGAPWELRQFDLSPETGFFRQVPLSETPDLSFNGTRTFANLVNQNADAIISLVPGGTGNTVPLVFEGQPFQAATIFNNLQQWSADGITDPEARFHASLNTCNGCHGPETGSGFLQISPRFPGDGSEAFLSPFITGTTVFDPVAGQVRTLNDLARRRADMLTLVCGEEAAPVQ